MGKDNTAIVWFRHDLRVHDNEALTEAIASGRQVLPVYVFDSRFFGFNNSGNFPKSGLSRTQFIIDSIKALRKKLHSLGLPLIVRRGFTEEVIFEICSEFKVHYVYCNRERTRDEEYIQDQLEKKLWTRGMEIRYSRGKMLYYTADLPFPVTHTPDNFNAFRKEVEFLVEIRRALPVPSVQQNNLEHLIDEGIIPGPADFGFSQKEYTNMEIIAKGGEDEAIDQLQRYIQAEKNVEERADIILSPYLSHGCLSPKYFYWTFYEHKRHLENTSLNKEVYLKLLKRDHYRLIGKKFGVQIFNVQGIDPNAQKNLKINKDLLTAWIDGQTGIPGVDANMIKLRKTGYIDFAARVICARFFVEELNLDWTIGASYFESALIDYDPCSNWVQWMCIGGVGMERFDQKNINYQELYKTKDKEGIYLTRWLPVLSNVPAEFRHFPSSMDEPVLKHLNFEMGKDYPMPII